VALSCCCRLSKAPDSVCKVQQQQQHYTKFNNKAEDSAVATATTLIAGST
jgi:hypothetical protein